MTLQYSQPPSEKESRRLVGETAQLDWAFQPLKVEGQACDMQFALHAYDAKDGARSAILQFDTTFDPPRRASLSGRC
jgi:hypothetical protein